MTPIDRDLLRNTAHRILVADLQSRGNVLSEMHDAALLTLCGAMADYAVKADIGRKAVALPTGMGKTSAIVAFILALERLGYAVPVAVAASKVKALSNLKRELLDRGVPEDRIGFKHSKTLREVTDEGLLESTGDADRLYMLVTHSRVNLMGNFSLFGKHLGRDRALMIWDETLLKAQAVGVDATALRIGSASLSILATDRNGGPRMQAAADYLAECSTLVRDALTGLNERGDVDGKGAELALPARTDAELADYTVAVTSAGRDLAQRGELCALFGICQEPLQVVSLGANSGLVWTRDIVPHELRNILVLDASHPIRKLVQLDTGLSEVPTFDSAALKRFNQVTVNQIMAAGGRGSVTRERERVTREVCDVIEGHWKAARGVLVFTFKGTPDQRPDVALKAIQDELQRRGVDTAETTFDGKSKLVGLTYGNETSLNGYEYCDVVVLAGILHLPALAVAGAMKGMSGNRHAPTPGWKVQEIIQSEIAALAYQAMSRGSCRRIDRGMADPMTAYIIHRSKALRDDLVSVMPGAAWNFVEPTHLKKANAEDIAQETAIAILGVLRKVDSPLRDSSSYTGCRDSVSCREVSKLLGIADTAAARQAFTRGGKLVESLDSEWAKVGHQFKRGAARYGFAVGQ